MLKTRKQILNRVNYVPINTNIKVIQIKDVCRICMNSDGSQYTDIFSVKFNNTSLADFVAMLTQIRIFKDDGYPETICNVCIGRFRDSYNLCNLTKESYDKLQSILSNKNTKKSDESDLAVGAKLNPTVAYIIGINPGEDVTNPVTKKIKIPPEPVMKTINVSIPKIEPDVITVAEKVNKSSSSIKEAGDNDIDGVDFLMRFIDKVAKQETIIRQNMDYKKRPFVCKICNKRFIKRSNLLDHEHLHNNVKNYKCTYCGKSFVQSGNYKTHLRVHTNERPYACNLCDKSYQQSSALKIHMRSHTNEKKYICDKCQKGFTNSSDLSRHKLIHDEVKKFKCDKCEKGFTQKVHLKKHLANVKCTNK